MPTDNTLGTVHTVVQLVTYDGRTCVLRLDSGEDVECIPCATEGWFPDKDDQVNVFEVDGTTFVEPAQWLPEQDDEARTARALACKAKLDAAPATTPEP
jgi:hypothetical protein